MDRRNHRRLENGSSARVIVALVANSNLVGRHSCLDRMAASDSSEEADWNLANFFKTVMADDYRVCRRFGVEFGASKFPVWLH